MEVGVVLEPVEELADVGEVVFDGDLGEAFVAGAGGGEVREEGFELFEDGGLGLGRHGWLNYKFKITNNKLGANELGIRNLKKSERLRDLYGILESAWG